MEKPTCQDGVSRTDRRVLLLFYAVQGAQAIPVELLHLICKILLTIL